VSDEDAKDKLQKIIDQVTGVLSADRSRIWIVGAVIIGTILTFRSFTTLEPGQAAVRVNNITRSQTTLTRPGLVMRLPFGIHSVHILDASPQTFSMRGAQSVDALHVRELTVRASDGSNFVFNDTTVIFRVIGDEAQRVVADAGRGGAFREWLRYYARSVLRDEFGRESTISVSNPANFGEATERARARMNALLNPHGLLITQIVTPRPRFYDEYEALIEARNEAENQMSVIGSELARAETDRQRRLAEVDRDQNKIIQETRAALEAELATAVSQQAQVRQSVDTYRIAQVGQGQAALSSAERRAEELTGELAARFQARRAEIDAFRTQPVERVMERLGERLDGVTIEIQPWADDATPRRVQLDQLGGGR
jgi:hypothetical protein